MDILHCLHTEKDMGFIMQLNHCPFEFIALFEVFSELFILNRPWSEKTCLYPFMPNGISHPYHLDKSILNLWVFG